MNDGRHGSARYVASAMMALTGAVCFFAFLLEDVAGRPEVAWSEQPWGLIVRYIVAMVIGGAVAGWLFAGLFGSAFGLLPDMLADGWRWRT